MSTPVKNVTGIGPKTAEYLYTQSIHTVEQLVQFGVDKLALAPGFSAGRAETVMHNAESLLAAAAPGMQLAAPAGVKEVSKGKGTKKDKKKKDKKKDKKKTNKKDKKKDKKKKDKKDKKKK